MFFALLYFKTKTMLKYQCNKCEIQKEFSKVVMKVENGKVVNVAFNGFPQLRRTEPSLSKRQDRMWKETKEKLTS
jgi:hypothetical protein